jgi:hypothetical protein
MVVLTTTALGLLFASLSGVIFSAVKATPSSSTTSDVLTTGAVLVGGHLVSSLLFDTAFKRFSIQLFYVSLMICILCMFTILISIVLLANPSLFSLQFDSSGMAVSVLAVILIVMASNELGFWFQFVTGPSHAVSFLLSRYLPRDKCNKILNIEERIRCGMDTLRTEDGKEKIDNIVNIFEGMVLDTDEYLTNPKSEQTLNFWKLIGNIRSLQWRKFQDNVVQYIILGILVNTIYKMIISEVPSLLKTYQKETHETAINAIINGVYYLITLMIVANLVFEHSLNFNVQFAVYSAIGIFLTVLLPFIYLFFVTDVKGMESSFLLVLMFIYTLCMTALFQHYFEKQKIGWSPSSPMLKSMTTSYLPNFSLLYKTITLSFSILLCMNLQNLPYSSVLFFFLIIIFYLPLSILPQKQNITRSDIFYVTIQVILSIVVFLSKKLTSLTIPMSFSLGSTGLVVLLYLLSLWEVVNKQVMGLLFCLVVTIVVIVLNVETKNISYLPFIGIPVLITTVFCISAFIMKPSMQQQRESLKTQTILQNGVPLLLPSPPLPTQFTNGTGNIQDDGNDDGDDGPFPYQYTAEQFKSILFSNFCPLTITYKNVEKDTTFLCTLCNGEEVNPKLISRGYTANYIQPLDCSKVTKKNKIIPYEYTPDDITIKNIVKNKIVGADDFTKLLFRWIKTNYEKETLLEEGMFDVWWFILVSAILKSVKGERLDNFVLQVSQDEEGRITINNIFVQIDDIPKYYDIPDVWKKEILQRLPQLLPPLMTEQDSELRGMFFL